MENIYLLLQRILLLSSHFSTHLQISYYFGQALLYLADVECLGTVFCLIFCELLELVCLSIECERMLLLAYSRGR